MKKIMIALLSLAACLTLALGLSACGGNEDPPKKDPSAADAHTHVYTADNLCEVCGAAWEYTEGLSFAENDDGTLSVCGGEGVRGVVTIPYGHVGKAVTGIAASAFEDELSITGVVLGKNVTSIGDKAFDGCWKLLEVWNFSGLSLEKGSRKNGYVAYSAKDIYTKEEKSKQTEKDGCMFYENGSENCLLLYTGEETQLILPDRTPGGNVYSLFPYAFYHQNTVTDIVFSDGVLSIGEYAFERNEALVNVTFGKNIKTIGNSAFYGCDGIRNISIPETVTSIGAYAFRNCSGLAEVTVGGGKIGSFAFEICAALTTLTLGKKVTQIGDSAFSGCRALTDVTIPDSVTSVGGNAFSGCRGLTALTFGAGLRTIGQGAFSGCTALTGNLKLPDRLNTIEREAFSGCSALTGVTVNSALKTVDALAFSGCTSLARVDISDLAAWCSISFSFMKGNFSNPLELAHHLYLNGVEATDLVIPSGVSKIGDLAFLGGSSIRSVTMESGVTEIGYRAFYGCTSLNEIRYNGTTEAWKKIKKGLFGGEYFLPGDFYITDDWYIAEDYRIFCTDGVILPNGEVQPL